MEREVEQNELPIVNKNTRKKQKDKKFEIFSGKSKELSKNGKNEAKTPDKQKNDAKKADGFVCGKIVKSKIILKRSKNIRYAKKPDSKKPRFILYLYNTIYCMTLNRID